MLQISLHFYLLLEYQLKPNPIIPSKYSTSTLLEFYSYNLIGSYANKQTNNNTISFELVFQV